METMFDFNDTFLCPSGMIVMMAGMVGGAITGAANGIETLTRSIAYWMMAAIRQKCLVYVYTPWNPPF